MKLAFLLIACTAAVVVQSASFQQGSHQSIIGNKSQMEMQKFLFEMLLRVGQNQVPEEWLKYGQKLITDQSQYNKFTNKMFLFEEKLLDGNLLQKGEYFSVMQKPHALQAAGLFNFFYYAKNWDTMMHNMAWARKNCNEGMFVHAVTLTVIHRKDMQGLILPQIYEIFPQKFFNSKYVYAVQEFDQDTFNRQYMLQKEMKTAYEQEYDIGKKMGNLFYNRNWNAWQWWKLMGLDDYFHYEDKTICKDTNDYIKNNQALLKIMEKLKKYYIPVDYTRDIGIMNDEADLSYFTEDVDWNAYWYYLNMDYEKQLSGDMYDLNKDRRGEFWIHNVQQIVARYNMERYSNGLGKIHELPTNGFIEYGYDPQLISYTGVGYSIRPNYYEFKTYHNNDELLIIKRLEERIADAISSGYIRMPDGKSIDMRQPEAIEIIGNMLQGNKDVPDQSYYGDFFSILSSFLSGEHYDFMEVLPNVLLNYETMMRDPLAYRMLETISKYYIYYKNTLPPYTKGELILPGVHIDDVTFSKLETYFDFTDIDMTTLVNDKFIQQDGQLVWNKAVFGRQLRLNHEPFQYVIQLTANQPQKSVIRLFLGPEFDNHGRKLNMVDNHMQFIQIDEFIKDLQPGQNILQRSSEDSDWTRKDPLTYSEMYNYIQGVFQGQYQFQFNVSESHSLFADRLLLPKGWVKGMPMVMFITVNALDAKHQQYSTYDQSYLAGIGSGVRFVDNAAFGFPLDRKITSLATFMVPNMYYKPVKIYHREKFSNYYPLKYENYGHFDYTF